MQSIAIGKIRLNGDISAVFPHSMLIRQWGFASKACDYSLVAFNLVASPCAQANALAQAH